MQLSILLLATDRLAAQALSDALAKPGHGVTVVGDVDALLREAHAYGLIILDDLPSGTTVVGIIEVLRADEATARIPILCVAQSDDLEERIRLLEAGADDVITKPYDQQELEARVEALALRFLRSRDRVAGMATHIGDTPGRRVVTIYSPKGGVGSTTIATNLAVVSAERQADAVALIDFDVQFGQVASHLNLQVRNSLLELIRDEAAMREPELFRTYAIRHESGVHVFAAPPSPGFAHLFTPEHAEAILARALEAYQVVIVDAGATFDERAMAIFSRSDTVVIPVLPEIPALNAVHLLLEQLTETGTIGAATLFVLNNTFARELLKLRDIETALGGHITSDLPYDPFVYLKAVNEGVPVVRGAPKSAAADRLRRLHGIVFGAATSPATASVPVERRGGLFAGLRRH